MFIQSHIPFKRTRFSNEMVIFLRPEHQTQRVVFLEQQVRDRLITVNGMDIETAAAWTMACELYNMPCGGQA